MIQTIKQLEREIERIKEHIDDKPIIKEKKINDFILWRITETKLQTLKDFVRNLKARIKELRKHNQDFKLNPIIFELEEWVGKIQGA